MSGRHKSRPIKVMEETKINLEWHIFEPSDGKIERENLKKLRSVGNETQAVILSLDLRPLSWIGVVW